MNKQIFIIVGMFLFVLVGIVYINHSSANNPPSYDYNFTYLLYQKGLPENSDAGSLVYLALVPSDTNDNLWVLSSDFAQTKPVVFLGDTAYAVTHKDVFGGDSPYSGPVYAWVTGNITKGDRLYTNGGTPELNGTLTNTYNVNYKTRVPLNSSDVNTSWNNVYVRASTNPDVYNRRAKLHLDGTQVAYALETINTSYPVQIRVSRN